MHPQTCATFRKGPNRALGRRIRNLSRMDIPRLLGSRWDDARPNGALSSGVRAILGFAHSRGLANGQAVFSRRWREASAFEVLHHGK